jgi:hypothetical protein
MSTEHTRRPMLVRPMTHVLQRRFPATSVRTTRVVWYTGPDAPMQTREILHLDRGPHDAMSPHALTEVQ